MLKRHLRNRQGLSSGFAILFAVFTPLLLIALVLTESYADPKIPWFIGLVWVFGASVYNALYILSLDYIQIAETKRYYFPVVLFIITCLVNIVLANETSRFLDNDITDNPVFISLIAGFLVLVSGILSLTIPISVQRSFVRAGKLQEDYKKLKIQLDHKFREIAEAVLADSDPPSSKELADRIVALQSSVQQLFLLQYRAVVVEYAKPTKYVRIIPFISGLFVFIVEQLIEYIFFS